MLMNYEIESPIEYDNVCRGKYYFWPPYLITFVIITRIMYSLAFRGNFH